MKKFSEPRSERILEILFLFFLFVFYLMWARVQPLGAAPDEQMRYQIAQFIYEHGTLPVGDDPEIVNAVWGVSYAFFPILDYMIAAVFMKLVSFVTTAPFALLMAARLVNVLFGVGTAWFSLRMGKRLFSRHNAWLFASFIALLPGCLFVFTYVNNDALAIFSSAVIVYSWVRCLDEGWTYKNCIILGIGVTLCTLSYYNAYGFILVSIVFFGVTLFLEAKKAGSMSIFIKKGFLVCAIVLAGSLWWFIRNAILYDGDFLARQASTNCAEKYALDGYKPSNKSTPKMAGYSYLDMLSKGFPKTRNASWTQQVTSSFVGRFGQMDVFMPDWLITLYQDVIKVGFVLIFLHPVKTFALKLKGAWSKKAFFHWCMMAALIIPNILNFYYSFYCDFQPQGRYSLPMMIPLAYFIVMGFENFFDVQIESVKIRKGIYAVMCIAFILLAVFVFVGVIWPEYHDVPFSIGAFISGS